MERIQKRNKKSGASYQATVRGKGFESVTRTFNTKGETIAWQQVSSRKCLLFVMKMSPLK